MNVPRAYVLLAGMWIVASIGGGALLALLARRAHPLLRYGRLWAFYSALLGFATAAFFAVVAL